jgi:hypothetical protein
MSRNLLLASARLQRGLLHSRKSLMRYASMKINGGDDLQQQLGWQVIE